MKHSNYILVFCLSVFTAIVLLACGGGGGGEAPPKGNPSTVVSQSVLPPGDINCPDGGIMLEYGIDDNRNGFLNTSEVDGVEYICHGTNGMLSIVNSTTIMSGNINCPAGGLQIDTGLDLNRDEILQDDEIAGSTFICKEEVAGPGLTVTQSSNTQLDLAWYGLGVGEPIEEFRVYESGALITTLANSVSTYSDTGLGVDTLYCYRVVGVDTAGLLRVQTNEVCATTGYDLEPPAPPVISVEQVSSTKFRLDWQESTDNIGVSGYNIYRDGQFAVSAVTNSYSDEGLTFLSTYCYSVTAYDASGNESTESNTVCATLEPMDITDNTPYAGTVDTTKAYFVANVTSGSVYEVFLSGVTANLPLRVYGSDSTFTNTVCTAYASIYYDDSCDLVATGDRLYIEVDGSSTLSGAMFTLDLLERPVSGVTGSLPYSGSVAMDDELFFSVSVTPGTSYIVNMTGLTDNANLGLFDSDFGYPYADCYSSSSGTTDEVCTLTPTGDTLYIQVLSSYTAVGAADFTLDMKVNPNQAEGTPEAPVDITGLTPYPGQVSDIRSYYSIDVTPGIVYDVSLTGMTGGAGIYVYNASTLTYAHMLCGASGDIGADATCQAGVIGGSKMYIEVVKSYGSTGAGFEINLAPSSIVAEGTPGSPVDITGLTPYGGTVDLTSSYYVNTATAGEGYRIGITGVTGSYTSLVIYGDDASFATPLCSTTGYCVVTATTGAMYIKVDGTETSGGSGFTLDMTAFSNVAEGSPGSPQDITGSVPYTGTVDATASYFVNTVTPGEGYIISLSGITDSARLVVYGEDSTFTTPLCVSDNYNNSDEFCAVTARSSSMYFKVEGAPIDLGSGFTIDFAPSSILAEGTAAAPVDITGLTPYTGTVDGSASYYVNTVTPGEGYIINLTGIDNGAQLAVYGDDSTFTTPLCSSPYGGTTDKVCTVTAASPAMYLKVYGAPLATGSGFTVDFAPTTNVAEGSPGSPVDISGLLPYSGTVDSTASYYVNSVTPGVEYMIRMTGLTNDADLVVYGDDSTFSTPVCSKNKYSTTPEYCLATSASGQMYIKVDGTGTGTGAVFELDIKVNTNLAEGSIGAPMDITGLTPYAGTVGIANSYYHVGGLNPGEEYAVSIRDLSDYVYMYVYDNSGFTGSALCSVSGNFESDGGCIAVPAGSDLYIRISGGNSQAGTPYNIDAAVNTNIDEGSLDTPVNIDGLIPYSGSVNHSGDSYYVYTVTPGLTYEITLSGLTDFTYFYVYENSSYSYPSACYDSGSTTSDARCLVTASAGKLYIAVSGSYYLGSQYVLDVREVDVATYYIETVPNASGTQSADTYLRLYDSGLNLIAVNDDAGPGFYSQLQESLVSGETYYIEIEDKYNKQDFYSIRISAVGFDGTSTTGTAALDAYEPNDDSANATTLTLETWQHHAMDPAYESDWFVFTAP